MTSHIDHLRECLKLNGRFVNNLFISHGKYIILNIHRPIKGESSCICKPFQYEPISIHDFNHMMVNYGFPVGQCHLCDDYILSLYYTTPHYNICGECRDATLNVLTDLTIPYIMMINQFNLIDDIKYYIKMILKQLPL